MYCKKIGAVWRKKDHRLGVLTFIKQAKVAFLIIS